MDTHCEKYGAPGHSRYWGDCKECLRLYFEDNRRRREHRRNVTCFWKEKGFSDLLSSQLYSLGIENIEDLRERHREITPRTPNFGKKSLSALNRLMIAEGIIPPPSPKMLKKPKIKPGRSTRLPPDTMAFCWNEDRGYFVILPERWNGASAADPNEVMPDAWSVMVATLLQSGRPEWIRQQVQTFLDASD